MRKDLLHACERKILRRINGSIQDKRGWHSRWNSGINSLHNHLNTMDDIKLEERMGGTHRKNARRNDSKKDS
jgi:hypothetical protein